LNVDAVVLAAVGQEQGFRRDGRHAVAWIDGINQPANAGA
jgi:hypothetical protein